MNLTATLAVKLLDQITGPAGRAAAALRALKGTADGVNTSGRGIEAAAGHLQRASETHMRTLRNLQGKFLVSAASLTGFALAFKQPIEAAKNFETVLVDIAQKTGATNEKAKALGETLKELAKTVRQTAQSLATGVDTMVGMGLDPDSATKLIGPLGKAATAYRADIDDLAKAGVAAVQNLKIDPSQFGKVLDMMAQAGKDGAFELKDMSKYIPSLAAAYQALGETGVEALAEIAAALQVVRKGTGDSATAATNFENVLQKIQSPETTANFKEHGIDIRKELKNGKKDGKSPIDVLVEQTKKALGGDLSKLGDLFADAQVQKGLRMLIQNYEEFQKIRDKALNAKGVVDEDFEKRITTLQAKIDSFTASFQNLMITLGEALGPAIGGLLEVATQVADALEKIVAANPEMASGAVLAAGGLLVLNTAALGLRLTLAGFTALRLTSLTALATVAAGGTAAGLIAIAGGIVAIGVALSELQNYEPVMQKWIDLNMRPEGKAGTGFAKPEGFQMTGTGTASAAGQALNEWIRAALAGAFKVIDAPNEGYQTRGHIPRKKLATENENVFAPAPAIKVDPGDSDATIQSLHDKLGELNSTTAAPVIALNGADTVLATLRLIAKSIADINSTPVSPPGMRGIQADVGPSTASGW